MVDSPSPCAYDGNANHQYRAAYHPGAARESDSCAILRAVLSPHIELVDIDGRHWANWLTLLWPPGLDESFGIVLAFTDGDDLLRAVRVGGDVLDPADVKWDGSVAGARRRLGVGAVVAIDKGAVPALFADIETNLQVGDDYVSQGITLWGAVKRAAQRGGVRMDPPLLDILPVVSAEALQRTFDVLVPNESSLIAYVLEDDGSGIHASIVASKDDGDIVFATTNLGIADAVDGRRLAKNWRKGYKRVVEVVGDRFDAPSIGVFLERGVVERIMTGPVDQLSRELAAKNIIFDPAPLWLTALLSGAAVAGVATRSAKTLSRFIPKSAKRMAEDMAKQAQGRLKDSGIDPWKLLGFNPIEVWLDLRKMFKRG